ncbi:restriction endonuclease fold toxin [Escherichia coli]|uniref:restriction endonuclease fold toxin n=1 Tax=Escherichia coli TaxID=562 RepID=UPI00397D5747
MFILTFQNHTNRPLTDFGGKTSIFSHPVYLFLREFSLQDFRGGSDNPKNFLSKSTRTQIKKTIELAEEQGKEAQFWFKYGVSPKVREYIESKGGKVILGMGN